MRRNPVPESFQELRAQLPPYKEAPSRAASVQRYMEDQAVDPWQRRLLSFVLLMQRLLDLLDERGAQYERMEIDRARVEDAYYFAMGQGSPPRRRMAIPGTEDLVRAGQLSRLRQDDLLARYRRDDGDLTELRDEFERGLLIEAAQLFASLSDQLEESVRRGRILGLYSIDQLVLEIFSLSGLPQHRKPERRYRRDQYNEWVARERALHRDLISLVRQAYTPR